MTSDGVTFGEIAYRAYCASVGGVSIRGERLPAFADQSDVIRQAWESAGRSVAVSTLDAMVKDSGHCVSTDVLDAMVTGVEQFRMRIDR